MTNNLIPNFFITFIITLFTLDLKKCQAQLFFDCHSWHILVETLVHLNHEHVSSCFSKIHCGHFLLPVLVRNLIIFEYSKIIFEQTPSNRLMPTVYFEATKQTFSIDCGTLGPSSHLLIKNEINSCAWLAIKFHPYN